MSCLTKERLKKLLEYDPQTGKFISRTPRGNIGVGVELGWENGRGYQRVSIDGKRYMLHKLAWLYMTGDLPELDVDHKDLDSSNNSWDNLRLCTNKQNSYNRGVRKDNNTGVKGVSKTTNNSFMVRVGQKSFGCYPDLELAELVAMEARDSMHGEFARHA